MTSTTALLVTSTFCTHPGGWGVMIINTETQRPVHACACSGLPGVQSPELFWCGRLAAAILTCMGVWLHNQCPALK